jgi:hypothetical protein
MASRWYEILRRYGLAACCIVGPFLFGLGGAYYALHRLLPDPDPVAITLPYAAATPPEQSGSPTKTGADSNRPPQAASAPSSALPPMAASAPIPATSPVPAPPNSDATTPDENNSQADLEFWTIGQHYRGRITYAVATAFLFLVLSVTYLFAVIVVWSRLGWRRTISVLVVFAAIDVYCARYSFVLSGQTFIVEKLLNQADTFFPFVKPLQVGLAGTGTSADALVQLNNFFVFLPIGMGSVALFVLSIRPRDEALELGPLQTRLTLLRVLLGLASTCLVIDVLAQKALMEWPLGLILQKQADGLRFIADALTLQIGAQGTMALIAGFGPAIVAWSLDASALRRKMAQGGTVVLPKQSADPPPSGGSTPLADSLAFAPLSAIISFLAVLAPLLASPLVDAVKSIFSMAAKISP